jgi:SAM-dependent methyltransferase
MPILTALGAKCTVLDYSKEQLKTEKLIAQREGYSIETINASMTERLPFSDCSFDLIIHPVSNSYVKDVNAIFKECFRVLKAGGILLSGLDNGINYVFDEDEGLLTKPLPFDPTINFDQFEKSIKNDWGIQFSHTLEEQIGGQLKAGFVLTDLYEDTNGEGKLHDLNVKTFIATRSVKR